MLDSKVINYLKDKEQWFEDVTAPYEQALSSVGLDLDSDIAQFYLHAEDGATFYSKKQEIYQICWFVINSDYLDLLSSVRNTYELSEDYIPLNDLSNGTYFYNKKDQSVIFLEAGDVFSAFKEGRFLHKWNDFNQFILWFFELN